MSHDFDIHPIALDRIQPDPNQPRKLFDADALQELAASIDKNGLIQPIVVTPVDHMNYQIVVGERRYRAHKLLGRETIECRVQSGNRIDVFTQQIAENLTRQDLSPLEEAQQYRDFIDMTGWTVERAAKQLGIKQPWRIKDRLQLLDLNDDHRQYLEKGVLTPSQAFELSRLPTELRDNLLRLMRGGKCNSYDKLRATADALLDAYNQRTLIEEALEPTKAERTRANSFKSKVGKVAALLRSGIKDNEIEAVKKVDPNEAMTLCDQLALMQKDLGRIEKALREIGVQHSVFSDAKLQH